MRGQAATGSGEAESGHDRRIGDQIVRAVLTGGITPFERGDGRGVLHTKTTARLKRERGLSGRALPREADGRIAVGAVREGAIERIKLVAELGKRVQCLHHRTLQILVDLSRGIVMAIDIAAIVGLAQQLHVVLAGKRADIVDLRRPAGRTAPREPQYSADRCIPAPNSRCC